MDLEQKYKEETGFDVGKIHDTGTTYYSDDYVKWLEKAIDYIPCCKSDSEQLACDCDRQPLRYNEFGICKYCGKQKPSEG